MSSKIRFVDNPEERLHILTAIKFERQAQELKHLLPCISGSAKILWLFTTHQGEGDAAFHESIVKVVLEVCSAICFASTQVEEVRNVVKETLDVVNEIVASDSDDDSLHLQLAGEATRKAQNFAELAKEIPGKFVVISNMIVELEATFTTGECKEEIKHCNRLAAQLDGIHKFFDILASHSAELVVDMECQSQILENDGINHRKFAQQIFQTCERLTLTLELSATFLDACDSHVKEIIQDVQQLSYFQNTTESGYQELEIKCARPTANIDTIIDTRKAELIEKLTEGIDTLKQMLRDGDIYEAVVNNIVYDEIAHDIAAKHKDLESLLTAAPYSVMLLGQLCLLSTCSNDFKLQMPIKGFKYIHSEWFRGALHQVVNKGATSFTLANKNVTQIEKLAQKIPSLVLEIFVLISNENLADITALLPSTIEDVIQKSMNCSTLASEVETSFGSMIDLINELAQTCTATRSFIESKTDTTIDSTQIQSPRSTVEILSATKISQVDSAILKKTLMDGLGSLIKVRQQWNYLVRFFTGLAQTIQLEVLAPTENYCESVEKKATKLTEKRKPLSRYEQEVLQVQARELAQKGFQVNMIASWYMQVSKQHLHGPLLTLDELLSLSDVTEAERLLQGVQAKCKQSQEEIREMIDKNRSEAFTKFRQQMLEIEKLTMIKEEEANILEQMLEVKSRSGSVISITNNINNEEGESVNQGETGIVKKMIKKASVVAIPREDVSEQVDIITKFLETSALTSKENNSSVKENDHSIFDFFTRKAK